MQEGCVSLMQMAKTSQAFARLHEQGVLTMCLLTDPTYGGVSASFATLGDVLIAEPRAYVGFAGPKVIEQTIRQQLPEGFQTAEFLLEHGMLDVLAPRENLRGVIAKLLELHTLPGDGLPEPEGAPPVSDADGLERRPAWDVVQLARNQERPNTLEYVGFVFDDFQELYGDRLFHEDASIVGGIARLGDLAVVVIGHQKGHTTSEMMERNFGMPNPEGYRKGVRLMHHAARFGMPVVTFVDTPGAYPGIGAEERGQSIAIAESIMELSRLPVPVVVLVTGEGGSGGALALGGRRPRSDDGELLLLGHQPGGVLDDPVQGRSPGAACRRGAAPDRTRPASSRDHGCGGAGAGRRCAHGSGRDRGERQGRHPRVPQRPARRPAGRIARAPLRPVPKVRHAGPPAHPVTDRGEHISDPAPSGGSQDQDFVRVVWEEARDLIKRLEGTTVQRFSVEAGGTRIEIERRPGTVVAPLASAATAAASSADGAADADAARRANQGDRAARRHASTDHLTGREGFVRRATSSTPARRWRSSRR